MKPAYVRKDECDIIIGLMSIYLKPKIYAFAFSFFLLRQQFFGFACEVCTYSYNTMSCLIFRSYTDINV